MNIDKSLQAIAPLMTISGLPSLNELQGYFRQGIHCFVNVSGIPLVELYPHANLACWHQYEFGFSDIFSADDDINGEQTFDYSPERFIAATTDSQRQQFLTAVTALCYCLKHYQSVHVFCHHGVGRSPAVSFAAICLWWNLPLNQALAIIEKLRPQARLTKMTLSATLWLQQEVSA